MALGVPLGEVSEQFDRVVRGVGASPLEFDEQFGSPGAGDVDRRPAEVPLGRPLVSRQSLGEGVSETVGDVVGELAHEPELVGEFADDIADRLRDALAERLPGHEWTTERYLGRTPVDVAGTGTPELFVELE